MFEFLRKKDVPAEVPSEVMWSYRDNGVCEVTVRGLIDESQFTELQADGAQLIDEHGAIKVLFDMRDLKGWRTPPEGDNLEFLIKYDAQIKKVAVVGDAQHKDASLMFFGAGYRKAEVRYFESAEMDKARTWAAQEDGV
jgi:hypothetical protein